MAEEWGGPPEADRWGGDEPRRGRRWWLWAPIGVVLAMAAVIVAVRAGGSGSGESAGHRPRPHPRFLLTVGNSGDLTDRRSAAPAARPLWFQVHALDKDGREQLVDSVPPPSPSAGDLQEIVAGPGGTFVAAASRATPCESRLYRFRLTGDGHATDIAAVERDSVPALVAGLAISPDGRRIAYATAPCADDRPVASHGTTAPPLPHPANPTSAALTVLDVATGHRRTWTAGGTSSVGQIVGEIVWASDNRTLGYTIGDVSHQVPTSPPPPQGSRGFSGDIVSNVAVHALDTGSAGTDLLGGRVLFRPPADAGSVTSAVMGTDGRSGYGILQQGQPPTTIMFSFTEGRPMHVTSSIPPDPGGAVISIVVTTEDSPRYACLTGIDSFGRVLDGTFVASYDHHRACGTAYDVPS